MFGMIASSGEGFRTNEHLGAQKFVPVASCICTRTGKILRIWNIHGKATNNGRNATERCAVKTTEGCPMDAVLRIP